MAHTKKSRGRVAPDHTKQLPRLRRIEGQVRGIQQMIEGGRFCVDIAHQISAVTAALRRVQGDMLRDHVVANAHAAGGASESERRRLADEIGAVIAKLG